MRTLTVVLTILFPLVASAIITWEDHTIAQGFDGAFDVYATDIDGDGDVDVVGAANTANAVGWWENDGAQNFTEHIIDADFGSAFSIYAIDMDGDGDTDVVGAADFAFEISWWENVDGSGQSWVLHHCLTSEEVGHL